MATDLNQMLVFARVVERGTFIGAARLLGLPKTTVSRKVQELEERLGTRLLQRTTRKLVLTEAGTIYYDYCARIVQEVDEAEHAVGRVQEAPRGVLRVTASFTFGMNVLVPILPEFMARYPEVRLQFDFRNDSPDLLTLGHDLAIRVGPLPDSTYATRQLGATCMRLYASPDYLARQPAPTEVEQLPQHETLTLISSERHGRFVWALGDGHHQRDISHIPRLVANDPGAIKFAALAGRGIALLPEILIRQELLNGRLQRVLPAWEAAPVSFNAVYASRRGLSAKVRVFIDFLAEQFAEMLSLPQRPPAGPPSMHGALAATERLAELGQVVPGLDQLRRTLP